MSDHRLREAEKRYQNSPTGTNLRLLNITRMRIGLEPLVLEVQTDSHKEAYGMHVFYLLHHTPADVVPTEELKEIIETETPYLYGMPVVAIPEAKAVYLDLCRFYGVEPEAV